MIIKEKFYYGDTKVTANRVENIDSHWIAFFQNKSNNSSLKASTKHMHPHNGDNSTAHDQLELFAQCDIDRIMRVATIYDREGVYIKVSIKQNSSASRLPRPKSWRSQ